MYYFLSLLSGFLIAIMVAINGSLAWQYGVHFSAMFVHVSGLILIAAIVLLKREHKAIKRYHRHLYLGGVVGVFTLFANNFAYGRISVSALLALILLGQSVSGLFFDQFGWLGSPKNPFHESRIIGPILIAAGIAVMIDNFDAPAVILSFFSGITIVVSRTINAKLAGISSIRISTFFNYLLGTMVIVPIFFIFGRGEPVFTDLVVSPNPILYIGGFMGVALILIGNIIVPKVPGFYLSLMMFVGQVTTGMLLDAVILQTFSLTVLYGGILVTVGLCADLYLSRTIKKEESLT